MRIGIDARLLRVPRGIGNSIAGLLTGLSRLPQEHEYVIYVDSPAALKRIPSTGPFTSRVIGSTFYPFWEQVTLPLEMRRDGLDVIHCPANTAPITSMGKMRLVLTVHDVIFLAKQVQGVARLSASYRAQRLYYRIFVPAASARASAIITDSEYSRKDILEYLNIPPQKVHTVPLAPSERFRMLPEIDVDRLKERFGLNRYVVAPAAADPRKNTFRVLDAFARFIKRLGSDHKLVLFGLSDAASFTFAQYSRELRIRDRVVLLNFLPEEDLVRLYNAAEIMFYPSLYEGFGLPILEAMACGVPVVTSTVTSIPEVASDAAVLVNPLDTEALARALVDMSVDRAKRDVLRIKGRARAQDFSWERMAKSCVNVYRSFS